MGVPKFYRWISERYPCLSQVVKDYQIPEFDNFYLDMNGIIHNCSHPNDSDPSFRISEEKIFKDIFYYLEVLFCIIKPHKVMFMAIDGVAPRAKMNQQRGRRFRSAQEAEDLMRKAIANGVDLPSEARFDSNCITPGTEFMARLNEHLKYFINQKLSTDQSWQKIEIIFSGHEVPGEGEHKIMDYIRYQKSQPDYDPNTRHCLYGLDADLIMLGLVTHEPHFSLLREEIVFNKSAKKQTNPESITFHLLHLSILREYLEYEFASLKECLPFPYDMESIIDDWVLMGYLVGNDFVPHLPGFHIRQEVLPFLYKTYIKILPKLGGYININGQLNMERFQKYLEAIAEFDMDEFADAIGGQRWFKRKTTQNRTECKSNQETTESDSNSDCHSNRGISDYDRHGNRGNGDDDRHGDSGNGCGKTLFLFGGLNETEEDTASVDKLKRDLGIQDVKSFFKEEDENFQDNFEKEMYAMKCKYYQEKFGMGRVDKRIIQELCKCYVVGIQWVLSYYYTGVPSWSWFYPYHYAPYVSDIKNASSLVIEFDRERPFLPFQQLLAVLPPASRFLLPKAYQGLMINDDSVILDFYPRTFETDLNGKQHEWEAVVLIPFIDEGRLLQAMEPLSSSLTPEEVKRHSHGPCLVYSYDKMVSRFLYSSPHPTQFPDINACRTRCKALSSDPFALSCEALVSGLSPLVKLDVHFPGFPTLKHLPHKPFLEPKGVRVFQSSSRGENMCMRVKPKPLEKSLEYLANQLIGRNCYIGWPYLIEAKVCGVADVTTGFHGDGFGGKKNTRLVKQDMSSEDLNLWKRAANDFSKNMMARQGIDVGNTDILVYVKELQGKRYTMDRSGPKGLMTLTKQWSPSQSSYPFQTLVFDIYEHAPEYQKGSKSLMDVFEEGSACFILSPPYYGEQCEIVSVHSSQQKVCVKICAKSEPDMTPVIRQYHKLKERYYPQRIVAQDLGIPVQILGRLTSSFKCERGSPDNRKERERFELGLNMKHGNRNHELIGYAQRGEMGWSLSKAAIDILKEYIRRFPIMFKYLSDHPSEERYFESSLFPPEIENYTIRDAKDWIKSLPISNIQPTECGSDVLNYLHIIEIDKAVALIKNKPVKVNEMKTHPSYLYMPGNRQGGLIPDEFTDYYVFDRVVNVASSGAVPFGLRGTIVGIIYDGADGKNTVYEVVFDDEFLGGVPLRCNGSRGYKLPAFSLLNLSYGQRWEQNSGEQHRISGEQHRISGEQHRISGEQHRISGEQHRNSGEQHRISGEQHRNSGEQHRISGEQHRSSGEQHRSSGEQHRISGEQQYKQQRTQHQRQENKLEFSKKQSPREHHEGNMTSSRRMEHDRSHYYGGRRRDVQNDQPKIIMKKQGNEFDMMLQSMQHLSTETNPSKTVPSKESDKHTQSDIVSPPPDFAKAIKALNKLPAATSTKNKKMDNKEKGQQDNTPMYNTEDILTQNIDVSFVSDDAVPQETPPVVTTTSSANTATTSASLFPATLQELFKAANDKKNLQQANKFTESTINEPFTNKMQRDLGMMSQIRPPLSHQPHNHMVPPIPLRGPTPGAPMPGPGTHRYYPPNVYGLPLMQQPSPHPQHFPSSYPQPMYPSLYMNGPPPHFLYHPSPMQGGQRIPPSGFVRGPKPATTTLSNSHPVNLNPTAIPFTPLQVERRQAKTKPKKSSEKNEETQKENNISESAVTTNMQDSVNTSLNQGQDASHSINKMLLLTKETARDDHQSNDPSYHSTMTGLVTDRKEVVPITDMEEGTVTGESGGEDEQLVDAVPSSDKNEGTHTQRVVVGEILYQPLLPPAHPQ